MPAAGLNRSHTMWAILLENRLFGKARRSDGG
jgi:hypothetical protein